MFLYGRREAEEASSRNDCMLKMQTTGGVRPVRRIRHWLQIRKYILFFYSFPALSLEGKLKITFRYLKIQMFTY